MRTKTVSRRKPAKRRSTSVMKSASRTKPTVKKVAKRSTSRKTTSKTLYVVDSKGRKTNLKLIATKK